MTDDSEAVLVTGLYGSGKSTLIEEMAERIERAGAAYAAIDVDWLRWYQLPDGENDQGTIGALNVADVTRRYVDAHVRYVLLAVPARDDPEVERLRATVACPMRVIRLDTPVDVIEARLQQSPTAGRAADLSGVHTWVERGWGKVTADLTLAGDGPLDDVATAALAWLGWPGAS